MYTPVRSFDEINPKLSEPSSQERGLFYLLEWAKEDPSVHQRALPIFERFAEESRAVYTLAPAIDGIKLIRGPAEAKRRWLQLLRRPETALVRYALMALGRTRDSSMLGSIGDLLQHTDGEVRLSAVRALGYLGSPDALPLLRH